MASRADDSEPRTAPGDGDARAARERDEIPPPPWQRPPRKPSRRPPLSRDAMIDAALALLRSKGVEGFTMRALAGALDASAAALYGHVASKDELFDLVLDRAMEEIELPEPDPERWQEQLKEFGRQARAVMERHPGLARVTLGRIPVGPNFIHVSERMLAILRAGGLPDTIVAYAGDLLSLYVGGFAYEQDIAHESMHGELAGSTNAYYETIGAYMRSLPADRFPNTVELAERMFSDDEYDRFELGLDVIVRGLASYAD